METFVVRIWIPGDGEADRGPDVLRGFVEHARSGSGASFSSGDDLLAALEFFLHSRTGDAETAEHEPTMTGGMR
jgi:hypothetical protein